MKTITKVSLILLLIWAIPACMMFKPVTNEQYSKDGLAFTHLSNWKITGDEVTKEAVGEVRIVNVEGPDNAILIMSRFPSEAEISLEDYAEALHSGMDESAKELTGGYEVVKMGAAKLSPVNGQIAGTTRQGLLREFEIKALNVPVPHRAELYMIENEEGRWFIVAQSPTEDWNAQKAGFQAMFDSLSIGKEMAAPGSGKAAPATNSKK